MLIPFPKIAVQFPVDLTPISHCLQYGQAVTLWCSPMPRGRPLSSGAFGRSSHLWMVGTPHCSSQMNEYASLVAHGESCSYWGTLCPLNVISETEMTLFFKGLPVTKFGLWELDRNISYESGWFASFSVISCYGNHTVQPPGFRIPAVSLKLTHSLHSKQVCLLC